jgi:hypothetical protein
MRRGFELCRIRQAVLLTSLLACALATAAPQGSPHSQTIVFPEVAWNKVEPEQLGWQTTKLDEARKFFDTLPPANLFVADHVVARAIPGHRHLAYGRV